MAVSENVAVSPHTVCGDGPDVMLGAVVTVTERLEAAPTHAWSLGPVTFVTSEFQILDRETEAANEMGEGSHQKYKERQKAAVMRRLKLGVRDGADSMTPPPSEVASEPPPGVLRSE